MKCYYHHDIEAIAICKSCNRALCENCAVDVHPGTACQNRCEEDVKALNLIIQRGKSAYQKTAKVHKRNSIALLLSGSVFFLVGLIPIIASNSWVMSFALVLGLIFLLWSFFCYRSGKQIESVEE
jgi:uncharacterized membrane protein